MSKIKIKIIAIQNSYGEEVCCIKCHRVNLLQKEQPQKVDLTPIIFNKFNKWYSFKWNTKIKVFCYNCCARIDIAPISSFYRKRRGEWVQIPNEWVGVGPTSTTIRERKSHQKEKRTKIKSNHGKIISKAAFRIQTDG